MVQDLESCLPNRSLDEASIPDPLAVLRNREAGCQTVVHESKDQLLLGVELVGKALHFDRAGRSDELPVEHRAGPHHL
jgi:hypothetical protein